MPPTPASNPAYPQSLFPNAVDSLSNQPDAETAHAVMAIESSLIGGASGGAPGAPGMASLSATAMVVGTATLRGGSGAPATGLGAIGDYYFRTDTPGTANQRIYVKTAAATWTGVV